MSESLAARSLRSAWHPCAQMKLHVHPHVNAALLALAGWAANRIDPLTDAQDDDVLGWLERRLAAPFWLTSRT